MMAAVYIMKLLLLCYCNFLWLPNITTEAFLSPSVLCRNNCQSSAVSRKCNAQSSSSSLASTTTTTTDSSSSLLSNGNDGKKRKSKVWFPNKIQQTVEYDVIVKSLYVRHVLLETRPMAQIAVQQYLHFSKQYKDPFGKVANSMSACSSRLEGGKIGWVDRINSSSSSTSSKDDGEQQQASILSEDVIAKLFSLQPKAGDVHIIASDATNQFHVVLVEELLVEHQRDTSSFITENLERIVGSHGGQNAVLPRQKLKGSGVLPEFPMILDGTSSSSKNDNNNAQPNNNNNNSDQKHYFIQTVGCQMNVADSERLAGVLEYDMNMKHTDNGKDADVIIFNTCSIRDHAEQKLYDVLGPYAARKRRSVVTREEKNCALIVTGCVAQQEGQALMRRIPEIDVVMGPQYIPYLKNVLESVTWGNQVVATAPMFYQEDGLMSHNTGATSNNKNSIKRNIIQSSQINDEDDDMLFSKPIRGHSVRAWVNVIHGCNEHCTYCVVPSTRGMEQSRTMENILSECLDLISNGYKEINLLGQNIDAYGRDMTPKRTFNDLLVYLNNNLQVPGENNSNIRIRYVTSHPRYFNNDVIDSVLNLDKICECFHMPFQSGDDTVLKEMRRGYTYESYMKIINKIRNNYPNGKDASICGDVIVGFPGETDEAFQNTLRLMEEVKFDNLNTFAYSPRPNTEAALYTNQVPEEIKSQRLQIIQQLAAKHGLERSQRYVGRTVEVLVEDNNKRNSDQVMGRTRQGRQVYFDGDIDMLRGQFVDVKITEARTWSLMGELPSLSP